MTKLKRTYILNTEKDTETLARDLAATARGGHIYLLEGDLGAGKSFFARAFIRALVMDPDLEVPSPTFTLVQSYSSPRGEIFHYDLYRLKSEQELEELGFHDSLSQSITLVEWPERLGSYRPHQNFTLSFQVTGETSRIVTLNETLKESVS